LKGLKKAGFLANPTKLGRGGRRAGRKDSFHTTRKKRALGQIGKRKEVGLEVVNLDIACRGGENRNLEKKKKRGT